ncbi:MAG: WYL domain-containing protein [Oscillospiraceae bacterium]|nr:WYL domain-containing protein [Oscillospiraceae bacterium]
MANNSTLKMKMLALWEILKQESDAEHPLSTNDVCRKLAARGIPCERKSVSTDVALLIRHGYEVRTEKVGRDRYYWVPDRRFSVPELKIMIDALQAATFVTEKKTAELAEKVAALGGSHMGQILQENIVHFNTRKHTNESIYYSVSELEQALLAKRQASFHYFDLNENHERVYRKEQKLYVVDPAALVFLNDNYYLVCWSTEHERIVSYRVDRMEHVSMLDSPSCPAAQIPEEEVAAFTKQTFSMFGGEPVTVTLRFANELMGAVYDKFGEDTPMRRVDEDSCAVTVTVQVSPTFWGWVFQFRGEMQIVEPQELIDTYRSLLEGACV